MFTRFALLTTTALAAGTLFASQETLLGPVNNSEDQFRYVWGFSDKVAAELAHNGLNAFIECTGSSCSVPLTTGC